MPDKNPLEQVFDDLAKKIKPPKKAEESEEVHTEADFSEPETIKYESLLI